MCSIGGKDVLIGILDIINGKTSVLNPSFFLEVSQFKPWINSIIGHERGLDGQLIGDRQNSALKSDFTDNIFTFVLCIILTFYHIDCS